MRFSKVLAVLGIGAILLTGCADTEISDNELVYDERVAFMDSVTPKKERIVFDKAAEAEVSASEETGSIIPVTASFSVRFDEEVTQEYVENTFSIKPYRELDVVQINPKYYQLTTKEALEDDQIYNIIESTASGTKKWAFQTEKIFSVDYTYPANQEILTETGVPEIRFNSKIAEDVRLKDYITIEPQISGEWKNSYTYNYRFEHDKHFEKNTTYTIRIKRGLKDIDGNELKEDYTFQFSISNEEDVSASLMLLNRYQPNDPIDFQLGLSMNLNKSLSIKEAKIKIIDLGSKENFIKAIKDVNDLESLTNYYNAKGYTTIFTKDIKGEMTNAYNDAKAKSRYYYYDELPIEANLRIEKEGYYLAILNINDKLSSALFQVNEATATCSTLANDNFMILYKGKDGKNNSVDVYVNQEKLGTTSEEGLLYVESFRNTIKNLEKEINYIEFKNGNTNLICDISNQVDSEYSGENALTALSRFHNGYVYVDRNYYKPGETVHFWGYAKNRKVEVKNATLKIVSNWDDTLAEIPLRLNEVGAYETEFVISDVNQESYITATLYIGDNAVSSRTFEVRNYELKQYQIEIKPESTRYLDGDTAAIDISASTYDGTPLGNLDFSYEIDNRYYGNSAKAQSGKVTTDASGNATIRVPLILAKSQTNILPETIRVTILNSYIDGEQESVYFTVYPYKHYADSQVKFIVDENQYYLSFNEYLSLDNTVPANDNIKVVAKAYKTVRTVTGTRYNKYTKEMEDIVEYREVAESSYDKSFMVNMKDGKGTYTLANYKEDKNCYYRFYAYLMTENGKELALSYNGQIYSMSYKTVNSTTQYEEVEYVTPIINNELTYTLRYETNDKLKVGDEVYFYLQDSEGRRLNDYAMFDFYTLVVSADGNKIYHNQGERPHFTFTKEMGANVATYTILYDSLKTYVPTSNDIYSFYSMIRSDYFWRPTSQITLCEEELSLGIEVSFDKEVYEPKDEAEITIKVTSNGKGVKASVNLSALDTAYIDANGAVSSNIVSSLMNQYYIQSASNGTKAMTKFASNSARDTAVNEMAMMADEPEMAGGGGGDDSASVRDDLRVTAFFESIVTDENGVAKIKVKLPDNITEWTIKAQAISNDYKAVAAEKKIKVSKDFFVSVNHKDRYLVGEHFAFNIKSFSKTDSGKDMTFKVEILDAKDNVIEQNTLNEKVGDVLSYQVSKALETKGTYKIKITGTCGKSKDILIDEIEVTESLLDATIREDLVLQVGDKIAIVSPKGYLYILNTDIAKVLPTIFELSSSYNSDRNDTTLIASESARIFNNLVNGVEFEYAQKYSYVAEKNIFKVMKNSSDDARLALRMLATRALRIDSEEVIDKIEVRLGNQAALWAKVNMNTATLKELREEKESILKNTAKYTKENVLYLSLAFADIGAYDDALELYDIVKDAVTEKDETEFELKVILAIKLNLPEMEELYQAYLKKELLPENSDFVKLYYVQNAVSKNYKKGTLTLRINGKEEEVEVKNVGFTRKLIAGKDEIEVVAMSDNLKFMIEQYKPIDFATIPDNDYIISKSYSNSNAKVGDLVEVSIVVDNKKLYDEGHQYGFKIEDAIPNNMTFVEYLYGQNTNGYLRKQDGQKLTINCWNSYDPKWNPSAIRSEVKYKVRITNSGEQYEPGIIMLKYNDEIIDGYKK
ncbi:MAG: Ig-like domain-containing protein [Clostridia bacterium]|nr:Ig-like domain-containing protein [Clostridia bacterium]